MPPLATPADFFVLRTPLLPFDELTAWSHGLTAPSLAADAPAEALEAALAADRARLRERMRAWIARPDVREAVFVASPSLDESLQHWLDKPDGERGIKVERSLTRYLVRMACRCTPFGLFAGCSVGSVVTAPADPATAAAPSSLAISGRDGYGRHTRLDMDYVVALVDALARKPEIRAALRHTPNTSLYETAGQLRFAESRLVNKVRSYHLVAVEPTDYLHATLERARAGARPAELAQALVDADPEISLDEAAGFIDELIDSQLLLHGLAPAVTGPEPIHDLVDALAAIPAGRDAAARLEATRATLADLDSRPPGSPVERYRALATDLEPLEVPVELNRLLQVDMTKAAPEARLGAGVVGELTRGLALLYRLVPGGSSSRGEALSQFRDAFRSRYEDREVPLCEALDEETGIGFQKASDLGAEASPLLEGLAFPGRGGNEEGPRLDGRDGYLLNRVVAALRRGERELDLSDEDVAMLAGERPGQPPPLRRPLADSFSLMATISAPSPEALAAGDFEIYLRGASGPSGANLLGRFCHGDPALEAGVRRHLRDEEQRRPDAVFAEVVHLPEGRIGNVLARPVLREHEIPFLGRGGAPPERQIAITDLRVSVQGDRVVLRSARLGKEVVPRLTSAHNFATPFNLGVYKFLCAYQFQGLTSGLGFSWGPLEALEYLPRLRHGRFVLHRARWSVPGRRLEPLGKAKGAAERWRAVQALRAELDWPRWIEVADGDNELPIDLDNVLSVETFTQLVKDRSFLSVVELWPGPDRLCAAGPEGRFTHEIVVPFLRAADPPPAGAAEKRSAPAPATHAARSFIPGSEWLYAKVYTGPGTVDRVLRDALAPVIRAAVDSGAADGWFFIRYGDPDWHLRLRFHGEPARLSAQLEPALRAALEPLAGTHTIYKVMRDTYEREMERYGGAEGIVWSERLFQADSDCVLGIVELLSGDAGADARWRLTLRGMDALLDDLGFDLPGKHELLKRIRGGFGSEFNVGTGFEKQLGDKFRKLRPSLEALLDPHKDAESELEPGLALIRERSARVAPVAAGLRAARLPLSLPDLAASYLHMHANRLLRSAARAQELVIYDFLARLYESRLARQRKNR